MVNYSSKALDATFAALSDPTRRAILARLARGESSVTSLAEPFDVSLPAISKHLRVLEQTGLLFREKHGRIHHCHLNPEPLKTAAEWIKRYEQFWKTQLNQLARYLDETTPKEEPPWPQKIKAPKPRSASSKPSRPRARESSGLGRTRRR